MNEHYFSKFLGPRFAIHRKLINTLKPVLCPQKWIEIKGVAGIDFLW